MEGSSSTTRTRTRGLSTPHRHGEPEAGAGAGIGPDVDGAAVGLDDGLADGQADPAGRAALTAAEWLEDPLPVERGHADALVRYRDLDHGAPVLGANPDGRARRRVAGRVLEQVGQHLVELA